MTSQPPLIDEPSIFLTVWDEALASITKPRMYVKWAVQPFKRSLAYACIMFTVMALVTSIYTILTLRPQWIQARPWIEENVPMLTMKAGHLSIEGDKTFSFSDNSDVFVRVDTTDELKDVAIDPFYEFGMVVTSDGILIRQNQETTPYLYTDSWLGDFTADGHQIAAEMNTILTIGAVFLPFAVFIGLFISNVAYTGLFAAFVWLVSGLRVPIRVVWSMGLYALTPSLLSSYILFIVYPLPIVSTLVFVTYMAMAVMHYRRFLDIKAQIS